jgi:U3 small nucleolar RNA-associated protein 11
MSFKKAQARFRKANKERSQPAHRQQLGLLEKKKDYVKRARDYNAKKEQLRELQERASLKNPDEFYFGMQRLGMADGKLVTRDEAGGEGASKSGLTEEQLRALKRHDHAYLTVELQKERLKLARMQAELQFVGAVRPARHTVFVEDEDEAERFDAAEFFDTAPELVGRFHNRPRRRQLEEEEAAEEPEEVREKRQKRYRELESRTKRRALLEEMVGTVELQKKLMDGGAPRRKVKNPTTGEEVYKWDYVRKR